MLNHLNLPYRFALLSLAFLVVFIASCGGDEIDPEEALNNSLEGDWEVESFTEDGEELMGFEYASFDIEFSKEGPTDGEMEWDLLDTDGFPERLDGEYSINGDEIDVNFDGSSLNIEFDVEIDGEELEMEGTVNGSRWEIKAERD